MPLTARQSVETIGEVFAQRKDASGRDIEIVPFGIHHIDEAFIVGVEPTIPQLYAIQGAGGTRKTTISLNIIANMCLSGTLPSGHIIIIDSLENGMTVERYLTTLRAIVATKIIIYEHWLVQTYDMTIGLREYAWWLFSQDLPVKSAKDLALGPTDLIHGGQMPICVFTMDFVKAFYMEKVMMTEKQARAWDMAGQLVKEFPVTVFGVSEHPDIDEANKRSDITTIIDDAVLRWKGIVKTHGSVQVFVDYMQEYYFPEFHDLYNKQLVVVPKIAQFIKETRQTVWIISQETVGQSREFIDTGAVQSSAGGNILYNASQTNWRINYSKHQNPFNMYLFSPAKSRRGTHPDLLLNIEPNSGAIFGKSRQIERGS